MSSADQGAAVQTEGSTSWRPALFVIALLILVALVSLAAALIFSAPFEAPPEGAQAGGEGDAGARLAAEAPDEPSAAPPDEPSADPSASPQPPRRRAPKDRPARILSTVSVPVTVEIAALAERVDAALPQSLVARKDQQVRDDLTVSYAVERAGPIRASTAKGRIKVEVPVSLKGQASWRPLGRLGLARSLPFDGKLTMVIETRVSISKRWKARPKTRITHRWDERATLDVGALAVDISGLVDGQLGAHKARLAADLDARIKAELDPRAIGLQAQARLRRPMRIERTPSTWLKVDPVSASVGRPTSEGDRIVVPVGIKAHVEVVVGQRPRKAPKRPLPDLDTRPEGDADALAVYFPVSITWEDATALAGEALKGQRFAVEEGIKVGVEAVEISGNGDRVVVALDYLGALEEGATSRGRVYLTGTPVYDAEAEALRIEGFEYDLETRNALIKTRDWMLHDQLVEEIGARLVFPVKGPLRLARKLIERGVRDQEIAEGVELRARLTSLEIDHVEIEDDALRAIMRLKGRSSARLDLKE